MSTDEIFAQKVSDIKTGSQPPVGDKTYNSEIRELFFRSGALAAMHQVMNDVNIVGVGVQKLASSDRDEFTSLLSEIVGILKSSQMTSDMHYFRNSLNFAPKTLGELIKINKKLPEEKRWRLLKPFQSMYHMHKKYGIFNVKFVSADGHFEAVYNRFGELLTEKNDPVNMGTYNFFGPDTGQLHNKYDVEPYFKWGNTDPSEAEGILEGNGIGLYNFERWRLNPFARIYYWSVWQRANPRKQIIESWIRYIGCDKQICCRGLTTKCRFVIINKHFKADA